MTRPLWQDPYAGATIESLQDPARARAAAVQAIANARARSMEIQGAANSGAELQSGDAWARGVQGATNALASIPQEIQQARIQSQREELQRAQITDVKAQADQRAAAARKQQAIDQQNQAVDQIMQTSMKQDSTTGVYSFDRPTFEQGLVSGGMGHLYPQMAETLDKLDASASKRNAEGRAMLAHSLIGIEQAGYTPKSMLAAASYLKANNVVSADHLQPIFAAMAEDPTPETVKGLVTNLGQQIPEYQALKTAETERAAKLAKEAAETGKTVAETEKLRAETSGTLPPTPAQKEAAGRAAAQQAELNRHNLATEAIAKMSAGRAEAAQAETTRHNRATEAAANPFGAMPTGSGAAATTNGPTGDAFLKTLPAGASEQIKALADGRTPFPTGMSYAKLQPLIQAVTQYDPTFDAANYTARGKARSDLASPNGVGGKTINAMNTAIQHVGKLSDLIEALNNGNLPAVNAVENWFSKAIGRTGVTNFEAVQPQMMKEIERLWRGAGGSQGDIEELKASLGPNMGIQQQREGLAQFVDLVKGKLDSTETQRDNILGAAGKQVPILFEQNKPIIEKVVQRGSGSPPDATSTTKKLRYNPATGKAE